MARLAAKVPVAILGSGNIGTDLLVKSMRSEVVECALFVGRRLNSPGMAKASSLGVRVSDRSIDAIVDAPGSCQIVFDCTTALDHARHWPILSRLGKTVIDLTPSSIGQMCVPAVNLAEGLAARNVNMVSCGGQVSIPLAVAICRAQPGKVEYIEVVSTIASRSAGPGTRINLDEYIETTERGLRHFSGCQNVKAIINLNPADPPIDMQTTVMAKLGEPDIPAIQASVEEMVTAIQAYVPGYHLEVTPAMDGDRLMVMAKVRGLGDYLPRYAGNLDIINCAAICAAEAFARALRGEG